MSWLRAPRAPRLHPLPPIKWPEALDNLVWPRLPPFQGCPPGAQVSGEASSGLTQWWGAKLGGFGWTPLLYFMGSKTHIFSHVYQDASFCRWHLRVDEIWLK